MDCDIHPRKFSRAKGVDESSGLCGWECLGCCSNETEPLILHLAGLPVSVVEKHLNKA